MSCLFATSAPRDLSIFVIAFSSLSYAGVDDSFGSTWLQRREGGWPLKPTVADDGERYGFPGSFWARQSLVGSLLHAAAFQGPRRQCGVHDRRAPVKMPTSQVEI